MTIKIYITFFLILLIQINSNCFAQKEEQVYKYLTTENGLANNNVYCAAQDINGFIWFGTENGVSRFDGKSFQNFTIEDGLSDNEIIRITADSKGRIWFIPFHQSICYFYKGKIYNSKNDTLLQQINLQSHSSNIIESKKGEIIIQESKGLHILTKENKIIHLTNEMNNFKEIYSSNRYDCYIYTNTKPFYYILENYKISPFLSTTGNYGGGTYMDDEIILSRTNNTQENEYELLKTSTQKKIGEIKYLILNTSTKKDSILYLIQNDMIKSIEIKENNIIILDSLKLQDEVNRVFFDNENNSYFLTKGHGILKKTNKKIKNISFTENNTKLHILSISKSNEMLNLGTNYYLILKYNKNSQSLQKINIFLNGGNILFTKIINTNKIIFASSDGFYLNENNKYKRLTFNLIKNIEEIKNELLVSGIYNLISIKDLNFLVADTIWKSRTTCANKLNDDYYIGTISGLYKKNIVSGVIDTLSKQNEIFNNRVSFIKVDPSNVVWVGFANKGLVALKDNKILVHLTKKNGLPSDFLKTAFIHNEMLWVGTNSGIAKINTTNIPLNVAVTYSKNIGLLSDDVNSIYVDSNTVYLGTDEGLSYFKEQDIQQNSTCNLQITGITVSNQQLFYDSSFLYLNRKDNNIKIDFVAISHSSEGEINYYYRLIGLKEEWSETKDNYISYPTLDPGKYSFEIYAINKFGKKSEVVTIPFEIKKMFYETNWFKFLMLLACLLLIAFYINRRISKIKKRAKEKEQYTKQIYELEQKALKSQMNPHFIFNSLNSIQEYVMNSDVEGANTFISNFSKLIRATLDNSDKREISLEQELDYIKTYLALEQHRFENKFSFEIILNNDIIPSEIYLPAMLFQPFLENSIRHGINNKTEGIGKILIKIRKDSKNLICEILDNGIGIEAAQKLGKRNSIEYQSKGMKLTSKRIELLNKSFNQHIEVKVENNNESTTGTKITLIIPIA